MALGKRIVGDRNHHGDQSDAHDESGTAVAALEHLTGPSRGTLTWLAEPMLDIRLDSHGLISVGPPKEDDSAIARLRRTDKGHIIEALGDDPLWVNRIQITSAHLHNHDMIEFCARGPISRYFVYDGGHRIHQTVAGIFSDAFGYFRASRKPAHQRSIVAIAQVFKRLGRETTVLFRLGVLLAISMLALVVYQQNRTSSLLVSELERGAQRLDEVSRILARTREEAITPGHLETLRQDLAARLTTATERVSKLESLREEGTRAIASALQSVVFLQGGYGFRETESGRMLRHVVGDDGNPLVLPNGLPLLTLEGDGPVAERHFTGTGFFFRQEKYLVTNRHVGLPWEIDTNLSFFVEGGLEPVMLRFLAYVPGLVQPIDVTVAGSDDKADIAILHFEATTELPPGLSARDRPPVVGETVVVLGYPTGLRSILAQTSEDFVARLKDDADLDFWTVAEQLANAGRIVPLASEGIVGRVSTDTIVYDAATTHGGSGGPVLAPDGSVLAVNSMILPEYGGSNLGVPIGRVADLLDNLDIN